jgi:hypothetical protein
MNAARTGTEKALIVEIFALQVEIASRKAGWRIEMEAPPLVTRELSTDC